MSKLRSNKSAYYSDTEDNQYKKNQGEGTK